MARCAWEGVNVFGIPAQCDNRAVVLVEGICVHEHILGVWLCPGHALGSMALSGSQFCGICAEVPGLAHDCPVTMREVGRRG